MKSPTILQPILLLLFLCVSLLGKVLYTVATDGRKAPGGFGSTIHERAYIDTLAEQSLESHPAIDMAWVEYDSTGHEWYAWVRGNDVDIERRYCDGCRSVLVSDMITLIDRELQPRSTSR